MSVRMWLSLTIVVALSACQQSKQEGRAAKRDVDPAVTSALNDQILVDPALTQHSNSNAVRPPEMPIQAFYPLEDGDAETARLASMDRGGAGCGQGRFEQGIAWADRLPPEFALPPGARVTQAAGRDGRGCSTRIVIFASAEAAERLLEHYRGRALATGYSVARQRRDGDHVLAGANARTGASYHLIVTPKRGGSEVALIATTGV